MQLTSQLCSQAQKARLSWEESAWFLSKQHNELSRTCCPTLTLCLSEGEPEAWHIAGSYKGGRFQTNFRVL